MVVILIRYLAPLGVLYTYGNAPQTQWNGGRYSTGNGTREGKKDVGIRARGPLYGISAALLRRTVLLLIVASSSIHDKQPSLTV